MSKLRMGIFLYALNSYLFHVFTFDQECVAVLTVLYNKNGAVSYVEYDFMDFFSDLPLYKAM